MSENTETTPKDTSSDINQPTDTTDEKTGPEQPDPDEEFCTSCGQIVKKEAEICPECGVRHKQSSSSEKSRISAALLALFLGGIGIHHFYLGNTTKGVLYLLFFWTAIPAIIALFEGIRYLWWSDEVFQRKLAN